jgi:hypothetical protein
VGDGRGIDLDGLVMVEDDVCLASPAGLIVGVGVGGEGVAVGVGVLRVVCWAVCVREERVEEEGEQDGACDGEEAGVPGGEERGERFSVCRGGEAVCSCGGPGRPVEPCAVGTSRRHAQKGRLTKERTGKAGRPSEQCRGCRTSD